MKKSYPSQGPSIRGILWWHKPSNLTGKRQYERFLKQNGFASEWVNKLDLKREQMISENQGLVISIASKWAGAGVDFLDLIQEGNVGMLLAVDKYDPSRPTKFSTMATPWIKKKIRETVMQKHLVHIPFLQQLNESKKLRINRVEHAKTGEPLKDAFYQYQLNKEENESLPCLQTPKYVFDLQEGEPALTYNENIDDRIDDKKNMARLYDIFWRLPRRERLILDKRLDLLDEKEEQLEDELKHKSGDRKGKQISKQRIFQLYHKVRRKTIAMLQNGNMPPTFSTA